MQTFKQFQNDNYASPQKYQNELKLITHYSQPLNLFNSLSSIWLLTQFPKHIKQPYSQNKHQDLEQKNSLHNHKFSLYSHKLSELLKYRKFH